MPARVLFIGLDAAEPTLLRAMIARGDLPAVARIASRGAAGSLANCMFTLPGAVWPEIFSGVSCGTLPRFFHPRQIITGQAAPRPLGVADVEHDPTFWKVASDAGRRVAVVDIPHAPPTPGFTGTQVTDFGLHDAHFGASSRPASLLAELHRTHGRYPVPSCDHMGGSVRANLSLLARLREAVELKTRVLLDVLARDDWDLFACAFSESHCAGHWFWIYHDERHWGYAAHAAKELREAVRSIYRRLDTAVGRLLDAATPETVVLLASHGMAPYVAGYQMLPEVLARLGMSSGEAGRGRRLRALQQTVKHWVPRRYWEGLGRLLVEHPAARALLRPLQRGQGAMFFPLESAGTRAAYVPNNTIGAIRLNLRGREPYGCVEPGPEADAVMRELREALLELRHPASGTPIVSAVIRADEVFGADHHPDVPDLIVRFRQDLGLLERCESARVGRIHVPVGSRWGRRTGDHSPRSAIWLSGPRVPAGARLQRGSLLDVAPTLLASLDCALPSWLDGAPLRFR